MHVVAIICVLITASGWTDLAVALPFDLRAVDDYMENVQFIKNVMIQDRLWLPILKEKIKMQSMPLRHLDHFTKKPLTGDETQSMIVVDPFEVLVNMMMSKRMVGTEVAFAMEAIRRSISCSVTKHVSMQGFLLHQLISMDNTSNILPYLVKWLEQMVRMSIDKLIAVNQKLPVMAKMYKHILSLLNSDADLTVNELSAISQDMLHEADEMCVTSNEKGPYGTLIKDLKKSMTIEELKTLEFLMYDEHLKGLSELNDIKEIHEYHGTLTIVEDVHPTGFSSLDKEELKKILTINRIKMNFVFLNLPIKSLAISQLKNIFGSYNSLT